MRRLLGLTLLVLTACTPTVTQDQGVLALTLSEGALTLSAGVPIVEARAAIVGAVTSLYCELEGCAADPSGPVYLLIPAGNAALAPVTCAVLRPEWYGPKRKDKPPGTHVCLELATVSEVRGAVALANLAGGRESFSARLTP